MTMSGKPTYEELEKKIKDIEKKFANSLRIFENLQDVFCQTDFNGNIIEISPSVERYLGYTRDELLGQSILKLYYDHEDRKNFLEKILITGEVVDFEFCVKSKDNRLLYGSINAHILYDADNRPVGIESMVRDVTERKRVQELLRESEEKYRGLVDNIAIGVALISPDMEILTLNNQMKQWFPHIDTATRPICYHAYNDPPRTQVCPYCPTIQTLKDGKMHESITDTPAGNEIIHYRIISSPIKDYDGKVVAAIEMVEDITESKRAEKRIQNLSHQLLNAHEDERQMISRELHDCVAQDLSTLKIVLELLFDKKSIVPNETTQKLSELSKILDRSISTVRNLSYDLSPPGLKEFGLLQTLATYCEDFAKNTGINVEFRPTGLKRAQMDSLIEINLYRLVQEGLNNVRKHAEADRVTVKLIGAYPDIILRIEDDGKGFDMQAREHQLDSEKRMGLRSMKERVKLLQGQMTIQSYPMKGTKIFIRFPFKEDANESEKAHHHY
jgi:PAS domain S-box-containing protein